MRTLVFLSLVFFSPALSGCDVFDPELYMRAEGDAGGAPLLADRCSSTVPLLDSRQTATLVDTSAFTDNVTDVASCTGTQARGQEGFFAIDMMANERWHVHVKSLTAEGDPVIYILETDCDDRGCQPGEGVDSCSLVDEHLTFVAPRNGRYIVAVDDANARGGQYELLPIAPSCGNDIKEHSETCERGDVGCTDTCQAELADGGMEQEPNNDPPDANILMMTGPGTIRANGDIASECDLGSFAVDVPMNGSVTASVFPLGMAACSATAPAIRLELIGPDGRVPRGTAGAPAIGTCPEFTAAHPFTTNLPAGIYYLRISAPEFAETRPYQFTLSVTVAG
jgi:hypothetical protein